MANKKCKYLGLEYYNPDTKEMENKCTHEKKLRSIPSILFIASNGRCDDECPLK